jgi:tetratricopeptide (TPR) repeat protein
LYYKGNDLEKSGQYEEAIKNYNKVLEVTPDYSAAWYSKGLTLSKVLKSF